MSEQLNLGSVEISLSEGIVWAENYRNSKEETEEGKKINAYLIPLDALKLVLNQDIDAVRAYKGINNANEQILMFVGTKLDPKTGIYKDIFRSNNSLAKTTIEAEDVVYDGTRPCPPFGDPESPLN